MSLRTQLRQDRLWEARAEALSGLEILLDQERRKDYLAVLLVLDAAFRSGEVTAKLVERALALLRGKEVEREVRPAA